MTSIFIGFNVRNLTYNDEVDLFLERSLGQFETWFKDRKDTLLINGSQKAHLSLKPAHNL